MTCVETPTTLAFLEVASLVEPGPAPMVILRICDEPGKYRKCGMTLELMYRAGFARSSQ
ncbi:MAG: hypothetical protein HY303_10430 [Candidatus Wallbacteria bacterium]|nr:hypothetical protein [Candidatus Wallbacteria bacterium]